MFRGSCGHSGAGLVDVDHTQVLRVMCVVSREQAGGMVSVVVVEGHVQRSMLSTTYTAVAVAQ